MAGWILEFACRKLGRPIFSNPSGELLGGGVEVSFGLVAGHPFNAPDGVGEEQLVSLKQRLRRQGTFVHLHAVVHGGLDGDRTHDASHAARLDAWGVEDAVGDHKQVGTGRFNDVLVRVQDERVAPAVL